MKLRFTSLLVVGIALVILNSLTHIMHWPKVIWFQLGYLIIAFIYLIQLRSKPKNWINILIPVGLIIWAITNLFFWNINFSHRYIFKVVANGGIITAFLAWFYRYLELGNVQSDQRRKLIIVLYLVCSKSASLGIGFKTLHWPGGKNLIITSVILLAIIIAIWLFSPGRSPED